MGVDTTMFVATKKENILNVMPKVIDTLNVWQRKKLDAYWKEKGFNCRASFLLRDKELDNERDIKNYSNGIRTINTYDFRSFTLQLTVDGENRVLFITHNCSNDYSDTYEGDKIIFSLGYWGLSVEMMKVVAEVCKEFGDCYFTENDCRDEFVKI
jgi:hypothetical protein